MIGSGAKSATVCWHPWTVSSPQYLQPGSATPCPKSMRMFVSLNPFVLEADRKAENGLLELNVRLGTAYGLAEPHAKDRGLEFHLRGEGGRSRGRRRRAGDRLFKYRNAVNHSEP